MTAVFEAVEDMDNEPSLELEALKRSLLQLFERVVNLHKNLPNEAYVAALNIDEPERLGDMIATHLSLPVKEQQQLLEEFFPQTSSAQGLHVAGEGIGDPGIGEQDPK
ncbi:MAG: LON peptidase substrate-binding domain-containing protein [bacterium]